MSEQENSPKSVVLPVRRSKEEARQLYNRISRLYDWLAGTFERKYAEMALNGLAIQPGETVLEIGFGTGYCLQRIARLAGNRGKVYGIDISDGMLRVTRRRLEKARLLGRVELHRGDALELPYPDETFNAAFMSFTLELFDTPEIPGVLREVSRTLKPGGRLGIVSLSRSYGESRMLRLYEWAHKKWPKYFDCRPILVEKSLRDAQYKILKRGKAQLAGLPGEIVIATKAI